MKNTIISDAKRWEAAVEYLLQQPELAFDTEYLAYGNPDNELTGFSLSWKRGRDWTGFYVPLMHRDPETEERYDWQLTYEQVTPGLKRLLENPKGKLIGQNFKVEIQAVAQLGIYPHDDVFDTMLVGYLLNTNGYGPSRMVEEGKGRLGLKEMSLWVLGEKQAKLAEQEIRKDFNPRKGMNDLMRVDLRTPEQLQVFADYAIADTNQAGKLKDEFSRQLDAEPKLKSIYWSIHREFMFTLADMEMFGAELDVTPLREMAVRVQEELQGIMLELFMARRGRDFDALRNPTAAKNAAEEYEKINEAVAADNKRSPFYPRNAKGEPAKGSLGHFRKKMLERYGLTGHPVVEKIKDDKLRPFVISHPHLAHKLWKIGGDSDQQRVFFKEENLPMLGEKFAKAKESTGKEVLKVWAKEHDNKLAKLLLEYRLRDKLLGTYLLGLPRMLSSLGRIHGRFNQTGARTGRLSSSEPNLQNQPKNKKYPVRRSYVATGVSSSDVHVIEWEKNKKGENVRPKHYTVTARADSEYDGGYEQKDGRIVRWWGDNPPYVMFVGDYSQLEIRLLAHMSQDGVLIAAILDDTDIHSLTARALFDEIPDDYPLDKVKDDFPALRDRAKTANFGVIYGMGPMKFGRDYGYTVEEAEHLINVRWMGLYGGVAAWINVQHEMAEKFGFVQTAIGQKRHLPAAMFPKEDWPTSKAKLEKLKKEAVTGEQKWPMEGGDGVMYRSLEDLERAYEEVRRRMRLKNKAMRQAQNAPIQGWAANVVAIAQRNIRRECIAQGSWGRTVRMLLQVHDEIVMEFHPSVANEMHDRVLHIMENVFSLSVPLGVSAALGYNWLDAKE